MSFSADVISSFITLCCLFGTSSCHLLRSVYSASCMISAVILSRLILSRLPLSLSDIAAMLLLLELMPPIFGFSSPSTYSGQYLESPPVVTFRSRCRYSNSDSSPSLFSTSLSLSLSCFVRLSNSASLTSSSVLGS